ncbi:poly-beta-hydroxybutyrate polymerase [Sphingomonas sp. Leaf67]|uniref:alpha/beta fold hydrolase n=1 Tax=Sphingomonas sp. Leaf67 TaxID=1736230 RepID=UPI0006F73223|nr:alpha/beta fold hydrolase [Sphingomonas sp. Leaf67]KQN82095.1 poly-beta-hydroxybutyrate polymerase [Sphingomonas sp. Leaf67]
MLRSETADDPGRRARALTGLRAYQDAPRLPRTPMAEPVARDGRIVLRDYGGAGRPVVVIPSLINPPFVLDLSPEKSLLRWLAGQGLRVLLVDWGTPAPDDRAMDLGRHAQAVARLCATLDEPPLLVGYCLGGTIALATAGFVPVAGIALIATPWHFTGFDDATRAGVADQWTMAQPTAERMGLVPMEFLQAMFWQLDPGRTVDKYVGFADLDPASAKAQAFIALEDWANAGAPLPYAAGRELFDDLFDADLPGTGRWRVADRIASADHPVPMVEFVAADDRIVPAASAIGLPDRRIVPAGHVGMIVGSRGPSVLWEPLAHWLCDGSRTR